METRKHNSLGGLKLAIISTSISLCVETRYDCIIFAFVLRMPLKAGLKEMKT